MKKITLTEQLQESALVGLVMAAIVVVSVLF